MCFELVFFSSADNQILIWHLILITNQMQEKKNTKPKKQNLKSVVLYLDLV